MCSAIILRRRENGFDRDLHERIRSELKRGQIGLAQNRLPPNSAVEDVRPGDCVDALNGLDDGGNFPRLALSAGDWDWPPSRFQLGPPIGF